MQELLASWNPERDVWETGQGDLFSGLSDVYSEIWPASGMTRNGLAFELPTWEPPTSGTECSSLPTPRATRGGSSTETVAMLPTPTATPYGSNQSMSEGAAVRPSLEVLAKRFPTPRATDGEKGGPNQHGSKGDLTLPATACQLLPTPRRDNNENRQSEGYGPNLGEAIASLLPTPTTRDWKDGGPQANVPTNSLLGREIWDLPEGWSLHRGDALFVEDSTPTANTATSTSESDTPGAGSSQPSDAGN